MKILVLGASGMLGSAIFRYLSQNLNFEMYGTVRTRKKLPFLKKDQLDKVFFDFDVEHQGKLEELLFSIKPNVVINCVGIVKQLDAAFDPLVSISINALLPHRIAKLCLKINARLIHISTDCVFSGRDGNYKESNFSDADDLYGRSKFLGEVGGACITLRTSIIGHEIGTNHSLIDWFLSQTHQIQGYKKAIFSGLPTVEVAEVIEKHVIPNPAMRGLYHLAADPISKYELLKLVAIVYQKNDVEIIPDESYSIDRSLNAEKFCNETGYKAPPWPDLINKMYEHR